MMGLIERLFGEAAPSAGRRRPLPRGFSEDKVAAAALLVEAGLSDGHFGEVERGRIEGILARRFELPADLAAELLEIAEIKARESVEWHGFTRVVKESCSHEERVHLIELLWEVALADDELHDYEASLIRRLCGLLYVSGRESAEARNRARSRLEGGGGGNIGMG